MRSGRAVRGPLFDTNRITRTRPELDKEDRRVGATFVNVLFGLVVTQIAVAAAAELIAALAANQKDTDLSQTRLAHLGVAAALAVLSWIGYHHSQQYPPFLIKFVNIPLWLFIADVLMVFVYYLVVASADGIGPLDIGSPRPARASPEAILVATAFGLYLLWDVLGYRMFRDPSYAVRMATPRRALDRFEPRRWVTLAFFGLSAATAAVVWGWDPESPGPIIAIDAWLVVIVVVYRLAKQAFSDTLLTRTP